MDFLEELLASPFNLVALVIGVAPLVAGGILLAVNPKLFTLILKNLRRNLLRTVLTCLATIVLVLMITLIWTVVYFLDQVTAERSKDVKLIISEKWSLPSQMEPAYADHLNPKRNVHNSHYLLRGADGQPLIGPDDFMTWSFYVGCLDRAKIS